jgi:hypothetical protein
MTETADPDLTTGEETMSFFEVFIPIIFFLVVGAVIASAIVTRHKERMTMLDKGMKAEDVKYLFERGMKPHNPLGSLKWGIVFVAIGLAVIIGMWLRESFYIDEGIYPALICLFGGIGLITFYSLARKKANT